MGAWVDGVLRGMCWGDMLGGSGGQRTGGARSRQLRARVRSVGVSLVGGSEEEAPAGAGAQVREGRGGLWASMQVAGDQRVGTSQLQSTRQRALPKHAGFFQEPIPYHSISTCITLR